MNVYTINDLKKLCDKAVKEGLGNKKILLSDDDEGNGYHIMLYGFTPVEDVEFSCMDIQEILPSGENKKDYIILG